MDYLLAAADEFYAPVTSIERWNDMVTIYKVNRVLQRARELAARDAS
jgi:hypothetical protein